MRRFARCGLILAAVVCIYETAVAETFNRVDGQFLWLSPSLTETGVPGSRTPAAGPGPPAVMLQGLAYERYFQQHGYAPPLDFLQPLRRGSGAAASIRGRNVVFRKSGRQVPLRTDAAPAGAEQATPYLLEAPGADTVLVVYPYYAFGCKDNDHLVDVYSGSGHRLQTFDSLPTHFTPDLPDLLVSAEKSGCCDSLKWRIRFYRVDTGKVLELACPEGFCGDVLFTRIGKAGPFFVGQEIVGAVEGMGASLQINMHIIDPDGSLAASGKIIHVLPDPAIRIRPIQEISPFGIAKLYSARAVEPINTWQLVFEDQQGQRRLELTGVPPGDTPAVVFLMPKDPDRSDSVDIDGREQGRLPMIGIRKPGEMTVSKKASKDLQKVTVLADRVNKIIF